MNNCCHHNFWLIDTTKYSSKVKCQLCGAAPPKGYEKWKSHIIKHKRGEIVSLYRYYHIPKCKGGRTCQCQGFSVYIGKHFTAKAIKAMTAKALKAFKARNI